MWGDADGVSHTVAIDGGRDRLDPALLSWMGAMKAKDIRLLEDRLDGIQDETLTWSPISRPSPVARRVRGSRRMS